MKVTNHSGLPEAVVRATSFNRDPWDDPRRISVTQLISPPQIIELQRRHWDEIEEDASDRLWAMYGTMAHEILRRADMADALTEETMHMDIGGWKLQGTLDRAILLPDETLQDYKMTSVWAVKDGEPKADWISQLNLYAHLLRAHGFNPAKLQIVAMLRDWSRAAMLRTADYPKAQVVIVEVPLWTADDTHDFIIQALHGHELAREGTVRQCTDDERWAKLPKWAVMQKGRKRATRLLDTQALAENLAQSVGGYVEKRSGTNPRCENYCSVAPFCEQYRTINSAD